MKKILLSGVLCIMGCIAAMAQNPIISGQYSADPTARVFDGKLYVYPSHDVKTANENDSNGWFRMEDYHVYMGNEDLSEFSDMGMSLSQTEVEWVNSRSNSMWAPDCIEKNGEYYFLFPAQGNRRGFSVGIAESKRPYGKFTPRKEPIRGLMGIDPCVLQDDDGKMYIYWGMNGIFGAELNDSMTAIVGQSVKLDGELPRKGLKEGPFAFKHNGKYYLTFPWARDVREALVYCMSDNPLGPFEYKGVIMKETECWTNHHSLVEYNGQWYLFYHRNLYSPKFDKNRSVCCDSLFFNPDGTIQEVTPTLRGVGITNARRQVQLDRYSEISTAGADIDYIDRSDYFRGWKTIFTEKSAWVRYNRVDFGSTPLKALRLMVKADKAGKLTLRQGGADGKVIATAKVPASAEWIEVIAPIKKTLNGVNDITLVSESDASIEVDWVTFTPDSKPSRALVSATFTADPAPMVHDGTLYLYTGHDVASTSATNYVMADWQVFSTTDMKHWTNHGICLSPSTFAPWGGGDAYAAQCVERNGKFYWYAALGHVADENSRGGMCIGVAVSDSPTGPFKDAIGKALITNEMTTDKPHSWDDIDPTVFTDDDGQAYIVWGNGSCKIAKLKDNMVELDGDIKVLDIPHFIEGPWIYKRNGLYYLVYAGAGEKPEMIEYCTTTDIKSGKWEYRGIIDGNSDNCFTTHPGIADFKGKSWFFTHNGTLPTGGSYRRSVIADEMHYNADGTIKRIVRK